MIKSEYGNDFRVKDLADFYGSDNSLLKAKEEALEFIKAVDEHIAKQTVETKNRVIEEGQDFDFCVEKIKYKWGVTCADDDAIRSFKYWRQRVRICLGDEKADVVALLAQNHPCLKAVPEDILQRFKESLQQYKEWENGNV